MGTNDSIVQPALALSDLTEEPEYDVIIVGGGLAGLVTSMLLSRNNCRVLLIEKKSYPFHRVCGEYVSNEVLPFLQSIGFNPFDNGASSIRKLRVSTPSGKSIYTPLDMGGFGLSRYTMDNALAELSKQNGTKLLTNCRANNITYSDNRFAVETNAGQVFKAQMVVGCYGKRDTLDKKLNRSFIQSHTGYMGVKYHIKINYPIDEIGLDNFSGGYCGLSRVEEGKYNLCYLYNRNKRKPYKTIAELEEKVLFQNPVLKDIFRKAEFLFAEPEVINEISFAPKKQVENHILMCGDAAGLITPLCGNGMAMAIHSARLLSEEILKTLNEGVLTPANRQRLEQNYAFAWKQNFASRLFWGRNLQKLFGSATLTAIGIHGIHALPPLERWLIRQTHGKTVR